MPFGNTSGPAKRTPGISAIVRWTPSASRQSRSTSMCRRRPVNTWNVWRARPPPLPTWAPMKRTRIRSPPAIRRRRKTYVRSEPRPPSPPTGSILPALRCGEHLFEILKRLRAHASGREPLLGYRPRRPAQPPSQRFVSKEAIDRLGEGLHVSRRDEERGDPVLDHVRGARDRGRDHGFLKGHRLDERVRATFHEARERDQRGAPEPREQFGSWNRAEELDAVRSEAERPGVPTPGADPPAPGDDQPFRPPNEDHGTEEDRQPLPTEQTSGIEDEPRFLGGVLRPARRAQFVERESVRNERRGPEPRIVRAKDFVTDRIRDEEDMADPVPIIEFDREQRRKHGQGRPL